MIKTVLSNKNHHPRDKDIHFFENDHKYTILSDPESVYTSVTTWVHTLFPQFDADNIITNMMNGKNWKEGHKYWGLTAEKIKENWDNNKNSVSKAGTDIHYEIECFMNNNKILEKYSNKELYEMYTNNKNKLIIENNLEWSYFINFIKDYPDLIPYRTEWTVYNEDIKIAGSIDMVYENQDGTLSIYDWKRCKNITRINTFNKFAIDPIICHLPDSNFWHYTLQLNTYKFILEEKYNKKIRDLYLVRLHPDAEEKNYELIKVPELTYEIKELFEKRKI
jgi:ATP-dependent exoDNAse (exonuclease V) beta subunit